MIFPTQRYFLDVQKLKNLGWLERTLWEQGLTKTMKWYINNPNWWDNDVGALLPHPRMLIMPSGIEQHFDRLNNSTSGTGWIGGLLGQLCEKQGIPYDYGRGRLEDRALFLADF
ncbi:hypothetical protein Nepgr_027445 [Nepenthes gracilis]|uniref:Uncharacterized protein n=1 Tax=Nepenthes gracilis TaxID=150966 RepID=A0AAD3Y190_NEPGR|nr:hypothetical protein Nepgr_027445 [Nepenthes gracilis]